MKNIFKIAVVIFMATFAFISCEKVDNLPYYSTGTVPTLSSSTSTIAVSATDSNNSVVKFSWTNPKFGTSASTCKYILQIDKAGNNFANPAQKIITGKLDTAYTGREINEILLNNAFSFGVAYNMDVRVIASYGNNNDQKISNTVTIKMTPYKVPPKVTLPTSGKLFIVGNGTAGGWTNPVPVPTQELVQISETVYAGVFVMTPGEFLILPENGNWDLKYAVKDNTVSGIQQGGTFGYYTKPVPTDYNSNFKAPATAGTYRITLDFQTGLFKIEPLQGELPTNLFIIGSATPRGPVNDAGWGNPVPVPSHQFTRKNSSVFELTIALWGNNEYLFLPVNGDWNHKYAVNDNSASTLFSGDFGYDLGLNFKSPPLDGTYKITVNFAIPPVNTTSGNSGRYTVVKQ